MELTLFRDISIILAFAIVVLLICYRLKIPEIIGFLLTGVIAGPFVLGIITNVAEIEFLAEIGIVLLLFTIGIEFSFKSMLDLKKQFFVGGTLQVILTVIAGVALSFILGLSLNTAILIGFLLALSSTAIILRLLQDRDEVDTPHGRTIVGILIFQDIIAVPMMLMIPLLSGNMSSIIQSVPLLLLEVAGVIVLVAFATVWLVPKVLHRVARTRSNELFILCIVVICIAMAWLTSSIGLSMALGAFLAGLIISESQYSHQALGGILPFRYVFTGFFFVSIGMLLDISYLLTNPMIIILAVMGIIIVKAALAGGTTLLMGYPMRTAVLAGLGLAQIGEFSFILSKLGLNAGLFSTDLYQLFLAASIITMALSPFMFMITPRLSDVICRLPLPRSMIADRCPPKTANGVKKKDHLVVIGYGLNGRNIARAAKSAGIEYEIIEMNPDTVVKEKKLGEPIHYGDATNETVLEHVNIAEARIAVVAISDPAATRRIASVVRKLSPSIHLIIRTRYIKEMKALYFLGANEVIPEEFETSLEIFSRVLNSYLVPREKIDEITEDLRSESYEMLRKPEKGMTLASLSAPLSDVDISAVEIVAGAPADHKTIKDLELRKKHGVTVLLIRRDKDAIYNPDADTVLKAGDIAFLYGKPQDVLDVVRLFSPGKGAPSSSPR